MSVPICVLGVLERRATHDSDKAEPCVGGARLAWIARFTRGVDDARSTDTQRNEQT